MTTSAPNGLVGLRFARINPSIEREQLGPHLRQLVKAEFLASYTITEAKGRAGFVITFRPGAAFFTDYDRFYRRQQRGSVQFDFHADRQQIAEPLKVAYLFVEKRNGRRERRHPIRAVQRRGNCQVSFWRTSRSRTSRIFSIIALAEAKKTRFDVQTLGGLKQYLSRYQERGAQRAAAKASQARREAEDKATQRRMDYDRFRRAAADRLFSRLPAKEQAAIEAAAHAKAPRFGRGTGSLAQTMFEIERARITASDIRGRSRRLRSGNAAAPND